ncbi:hypothetical protein GOBAR_AA03582 [Gossypium barbadense]|uniref:Zinc knuckle CX2CX4HX4C domain-containing protein n=1 Tax=Gossypium barbadense TaxID=3634 RepID=A0A2P5YN41_GOSBA|nr:hypothetical protein GOBAR_AA03582 [Gossypium barbadense]
MEDELVNLYLANEEEEPFQEDPKNSTNDLKFCLVGSCLTDSVVHFSSLRNTLANLWHPIRGIAIMDLGDKRWSLHHTLFWVQIHDLSPGLMSKTMARRFGAFLGEFLDYDTRIPSMGVQRFMQVRVRINVQLPLRRKKKVLLGERFYYARFQYEKLSLFCFICGKLGHEESFYPVRVRVDLTTIIFGWDITLGHLSRRRLVGERVSMQRNLRNLARNFVPNFIIDTTNKEICSDFHGNILNGVGLRGTSALHKNEDLSTGSTRMRMTDFPSVLLGFIGILKNDSRKEHGIFFDNWVRTKAYHYLSWVILMRLFILLRSKVVVAWRKRVWLLFDQCYLIVSLVIWDIQDVGSLGNEANLLQLIVERD